MGCCCSRVEEYSAGANQEYMVKSSAKPKKSQSQTTHASELSNSTGHSNSSSRPRSSTNSKEKKSSSNSKEKFYIAPWDYQAGSKAELTLKAGERLKLLKDVGGNAGPGWLFVTKIDENRSGTGYVPKTYLAEEGTLAAEPWYFGNLGRLEAENILKDAFAGTFLVRDCSRKTGYKRTAETRQALSVNGGVKIRHFEIWKHVTKKTYFLTHRTHFDTIPLLIDAYKKKDPLGRFPCVLLRAALRPPPGRVALSVDAQKNWREIPRMQIIVGREIGRGHFAVVYEGAWNNPDGGPSVRVAIKALKHGSTRARDQFLKEAVTMKNLNHKRLVRMFGVVSTEEPYWLLTEFVVNGALREYLRSRQQRKQPLTERQLIEISAQVADGMRYLESKKVVHRDLAARNILVSEMNRGAQIDVKIADFGLAKLLMDTDDAEAVQKHYRDVPLKWTAPEALAHGKYSSASDVWSFGILTHEIFTHGLEPYEVMPNTWVQEYVVKKKQILHKHDSVPERVYEMMTRCWRYEPAERPKFKDIFAFFDCYYKPQTCSLRSASSRSISQSNK